MSYVQKTEQEAYRLSMINYTGEGMTIPNLWGIPLKNIPVKFLVLPVFSLPLTYLQTAEKFATMICINVPILKKQVFLCLPTRKDAKPTRSAK